MGVGIGFEVMDSTPHTKIRGDVAGQVSPPPPSEKIVPTPLVNYAGKKMQALTR